MENEIKETVNENVSEDVGSVNEDKKFDYKDKDKYGLNSRQRHFADLYMMSMEVGNSYALAYGIPNGNSASAAGSRLAKNKKIVKYIAEQKQKLLFRKKVASQEDVLFILSTIAYDPDEKTANKLRALELLGKHHGTWSETLNINHQMDFDIKLIDSAQHNIINQHTQAIEQKDDKLFEAEYEEVEDEE